MSEGFRSRALAKAKSLGDSFTSKKPHFNFITAHYLWVLSGTIVASILIFAGGKGNISYTDALLFASGANSQAGLNPVDVNLLNTFQQIVMYIFPMLSNPITLHGSVVLLRLYWFEKRFQGLVKDVRQRRMPLSKSKSKARDDLRRVEEGVNGRDITRVNTSNETSHRVTNDGVLLSPENIAPNEKAVSSSSGSETTFHDDKIEDVNNHYLAEEHADLEPQATTQPATQPQETPNPGQTQPRPFGSITFAETVKRSDGIEEDMIVGMRNHSKSEHIAILERQRNQDNEVLRIPGPREIERGLGPRRLDEDDQPDDDNALYGAVTRDSRPDQMHMRRNPTITIAEPEHRRKDDAADDGRSAAGMSFRRRTSRMFSRPLSAARDDDADSRMTRGSRARTMETLRSALSRDKYDDMPYLSYNPTIGRNSNFVGLTLEQREELGGIEYRSLRTLAFILLGYFWGFHLLAITCLLPFILHNNHYGDILADFGVGRVWWAFWSANLSFMDVGFSLTPDSMISFQTSEYVLMVLWFFIIIGNTAFPVMLRFIIWVMSKIVPRHSGLWEELRFLLDHPRRCFTLLFPSAANWWLFGILVALNVIDVVFFIVLDIDAPAIQHLPVHTRVVNGLFQAASTRTAGFSSVNLSDLHPAMPVLYMIMMYISVFPIAISIRRTNVYEEKSLGVYPDKKDDDIDEENVHTANAMSYVGTHLRRQLSFDLWFVFLGFFLLAISEGSRIKAGKFEMFSILFEIVSAYGTVGLSLGAPGINASLCSQFSIPGKLIIVAMEIRGRHRGLPYGLDRAVILPSESRLRKTEEDSQPPEIGRTITKASTIATQGGLQRRGSTVSRRGSFTQERDHRLLTKFLHPGPVVPPGVIHSQKRRKSVDSQALSQVLSNGSKQPQSEMSAGDGLEGYDHNPDATNS
ncbi:unnamed protein product [Clonostachys rosea f. rosea IK726]|uniref:Potassium transport protein n=2 Tax=Bionectria ochroleuca TaxID=29856 RepID=A0A0B7JS31_BIOOC|nr:unnamed protein product [Clonostachys rosea f. rosea IK726]